MGRTQSDVQPAAVGGVLVDSGLQAQVGQRLGCQPLSRSFEAGAQWYAAQRLLEGQRPGFQNSLYHRYHTIIAASLSISFACLHNTRGSLVARLCGLVVLLVVWPEGIAVGRITHSTSLGTVTHSLGSGQTAEQTVTERQWWFARPGNCMASRQVVEFE